VVQEICLVLIAWMVGQEAILMQYVSPFADAVLSSPPPPPPPAPAQPPVLAQAWARAPAPARGTANSEAQSAEPAVSAAT
jgi:hypothetical protein